MEVPGGEGGSREVQPAISPSRFHLLELGSPLTVTVGREWACLGCCFTLGEGTGGLQVASA